MLDTFLARKTTDKFPNIDLTDKKVIFTGGTDGMGRIAVERLAEMGADICLLGRSKARAEEIANQLKASGHKGEFTAIECDLSQISQVHSVAQQLLDRFQQIDYLINCAGINFAERKLTSEGNEMNLAVNYIAPYLLTELLLERIKETPNARILQLASATQSVAKLYLDDLHHEHHQWSLLNSYAQAKLCLIMHSRDLARRLQDSTASISILNPGYIRSNLGRHIKSGPERMFNKLFGNLAAPTWVGGERIIYAALAPEYKEKSGQFIYEDIIIEPNPLALDENNVKSLIKISHKLIDDPSVVKI